MTNYFVYGGILGFFVGVLFGYILKHIQDTKHIDRMNDIRDEEVANLCKRWEDCEKHYKDEINRLHSTIARTAKERLIESPERAKMTDFVEIALTQDDYQEIDFPNSRRDI